MKPDLMPIKTLVVLFLLSNIVLVLLFISNEANRMRDEIQKNIYEYEEVDLSHLCQMFECVLINNNGITYENIQPKEYVKLLPTTHTTSTKLLNLGNGTYILKNLTLLVEVKIDSKFDGFVVCKEQTLYFLIFNIYYQVFSVILLLNFIFLYKNIKQKHHIEIKEKMLIENNMRSQTISALVENIHHEFNTPLTVIQNKFKKLDARLNKNNVSCQTVCHTKACFEDSKIDLHIVNTAILQITDILDRMKPIKYIRHEDNELSIYTMIKSAESILKVSQSELFNITIDENLNKYSIDNEIIKSGVFIGILINFIKNSIEASANNIDFDLIKFNNSNSLCDISIADNGNGIPKEFQKKIFNEQSSSKKGKIDSERGNGLYINKLLLSSSHGDIKLFDSNNEGTIFKLTLKVKNRSKDI